MKEAIAKAIKNKFGKNKMNKDVNIIGYKTLNGDQDFYEFSLYHLLFGTGFVECLVGEEVRSLEDCRPCNDKCFTGTGERCQKLPEWHDADYHRAIMVNIKDIEELKAYIRGLV